MHNRVLQLGPDIFHKQDEYNRKKFEKNRLEIEKSINDRFKSEREEALQLARKEYNAIFSQEEGKLKRSVNTTLFTEASRIKAREWLQNQYNYAENISHGKKEFEVSLKKAREDFEKEKLEAINDKLNELTNIANEKKAKKKLHYEKIIDELNSGWEAKMHVLKEDMRRKREEKLKYIAGEVELLQKELDERFREIMATKKEKQKLEIDFINRKLKLEKENGDILKANILGMEMKQKHIMLNRENVIETFKRFISSTTGKKEDEVNKILKEIMSEKHVNT